MNYNDAEYQRSNGAVSSGAIHAYNLGATGQGVDVAVVDSGINPNLEEFTGRIHPASRDMVQNRGIVDTEGHGTAVSGVIAANRNGSGAMGIAFESRILSLNTSDPANCDAEDGCKHSGSAIAQAIDVARVNGAKIVNMSLGGEAVGSLTLAAVQRAVAAGMVIIISAGNDTAADPSGFATGIANQVGNGQVIIAGAMDAERNMATFSNLAGTGAAHFLVAVGNRVRTIDENGTATLWSGTSFAAPVVSGAAALLASAFPNLTGRQIVQLLLTTADDAGAPGRDSTFGNGILNIQQAFSPQGQTTMAGSSVPTDEVGGDGSGSMGDATPNMTGAIILDGYSRAYAVDFANMLSRARQQRPLAQSLQTDLSTGFAAAGKTMVSVTMRRNIHGRPHVGLAQTGMSYEDSRSARAIAGYALSKVTPATAVALGFSETGRSLQLRLSDRDGTPFLIARDPLGRTGFHSDGAMSMGVRHDVGPVALTATGERGAVQREGPRRNLARPTYSLSSITADRRIGDAGLALGVSRLGEEESVLGGRFGFAPGGSTSYFLDASGTYDLGSGWGAGASYRRGWTRMPGANGLVSSGSLSTDAFAVDLFKRDAFSSGDHFGFRIAQPLRVRSGGYMLNLPVSYDYSTLGIGYERRRFNLAPTGREVDFEAAYGVGLLGGAAHLSANAFWRLQPGHVEASPSDKGAALRFTLGF